MSVPFGRRSFRVGPWHYCARCGTRRHISQMQWQRGLLLCKDTPENCFDTGNDGFPLVGQREAYIASVFTNPSQELMPDPKLTDSISIEASMEEDLIVV
jgi:hypothetical protein